MLFATDPKVDEQKVHDSPFAAKISKSANLNQFFQPQKFQQASRPVDACPGKPTRLREVRLNDTRLLGSGSEVQMAAKGDNMEIDEGLYSRQLYVLGHDAMRRMAGRIRPGSCHCAIEQKLSPVACQFTCGQTWLCCSLPVFLLSSGGLRVVRVSTVARWIRLLDPWPRCRLWRPARLGFSHRCLQGMLCV